MRAVGEEGRKHGREMDGASREDREIEGASGMAMGRRCAVTRRERCPRGEDWERETEPKKERERFGGERETSGEGFAGARESGQGGEISREGVIERVVDEGVGRGETIGTREQGRPKGKEVSGV